MRVAELRFPVIVVLLLVLATIGWRLWPSAGELPAGLSSPALPQARGDILQPFLPLQPIPDLDPLRVALGQKLFHDSRLSSDFSLACASCHRLDQGGVDGRKVSLGVAGALGGINAPSVFNSGYSIAQFWDGRAATLEEQAAGPIQNPVEMASTLEQVLERLAQDKELKAEFRKAYSDGLTLPNMFNAIATFERSLVTLDARFDRYLKGDRHALDALEIQGYRRFRELGCASCHQGMLLGGNMFQKFGVLGDYFAGRQITPADLGRYNVTRRDEDRHVFKVPSLRNVAQTAPYFHDASAATLKQAVTVMARYQLGRELADDDVAAIVAFLGTLSGEVPPVGAP